MNEKNGKRDNKLDIAPGILDALINLIVTKHLRKGLRLKQVEWRWDKNPGHLAEEPKLSSTL